MEVPHLEYIEQIENILSKIHNGRNVHEKENCRQSLTFFIYLIKENKPLSDKLNVDLLEIIHKSKKVIKEHFSH